MPDRNACAMLRIVGTQFGVILTWKAGFPASGRIFDAFCSSQSEVSEHDDQATPGRSALLGYGAARLHVRAPARTPVLAADKTRPTLRPVGPPGRCALSRQPRGLVAEPGSRAKGPRNATASPATPRRPTRWRGRRCASTLGRAGSRRRRTSDAGQHRKARAPVEGVAALLQRRVRRRQGNRIAQRRVRV